MEFRLLSYNKGSYLSLIEVFKCMRGYFQKEIKQLFYLESVVVRGNDILKQINQGQDFFIRELKSLKLDILKGKEVLLVFGVSVLLLNFIVLNL